MEAQVTTVSVAYGAWGEKSLDLIPFISSEPNSSRIAKISILKWEGITGKISYDRHVYESVGERNLSYVIFENSEKIQAVKALQLA